MKLAKRAPREGVAQGQFYPEPFDAGRHPRLAFWYRFLLGRPMDGQRWTNSTFWRSASEGEDHWWLRLAGWHRLMVRVCVSWLLLISLPLTATWLLGAQQFVLQVLLLHLLTLTAPLLLLDHWFRKELGVRAPLIVSELVELSEQQELELKGADAPTRRRLRMVTLLEGRRTWEHEVVEPVALAASSVLDTNWRPGEARRWVEVPRNYLEDGGAPVEIMLPRRWGASEAKKKALLQAVKPRLGMLEAREQWQLQGRSPRLLLSMPPAPPAIAHYADYEQMLLAATQEYRPVLGVVAGGELLSAEMVSDSPHIALSAGSGAGKSKMGGIIVAQQLHWGWCALILDWKEESYEWARGLPGVRYYSTVEAIHDACVSIGDEVERRKALPKEQRAALPRLTVVREEWNMTAALLADYWAHLRATADIEERRTMPLRSPALTAIQKLDFAGRAFGMFDLLKAQRMSNRVFNGNTDIRENFMIRLLARYTVQTWKMLLPHLKYMKKPSELGRWVVAAGDEATYVQGILASDEELRRLATGGAPNPASPWALSSGTPPDATSLEADYTLGDQLRPDATVRNADHPVLDYRPAPVILKKLSDISVTLEYLGITHHMLRNAAREDEKGDPNFPPVRGGTPQGGYLYDLGEVTEWARRKRATEQAEKVARNG
jgi:hypothetical protein